MAECQSHHEAFWLDAGVIARAHGVRGELRVILDVSADTDVCKLLGHSVRLLPRSGGVPQVVEVVQVRPVNGAVLVTLACVSDRDAAQALAGARVQVRESELPAPGPGEFYLYELAGVAVHDAAGVELGIVRHISDNGGQPLLVLDGPQGERLLPAVPAIIRKFDRSARALQVWVPPGLWE